MHTSEEKELSELAKYYTEQIENAYQVLDNSHKGILDYVTAGAIIVIHEAVKKYVENRFFNKESQDNPWKTVAKKIEDKVEVFILFASTVHSDISYQDYSHLSKCRNDWAHSNDTQIGINDTNTILSYKDRYIGLIKAIEKLQ
jgi:hypothetical protein